jgi:hypothetical protein
LRKVSAQPNLLSVYLNSKLRTGSPVEFHRIIQNVSNGASIQELDSRLNILIEQVGKLTEALTYWVQ